MKVQPHYPEIRGLGGDLLVVSFSPPARLQPYLAAHPWPFPVVSDPDRRAYRALDLGRSPWRHLLGVRALLGYLALFLRGRKPELPAGGDDVHQLGGDFVIDARERLVYLHPSRDPADRPPVSDLLDALRRAADAARAKS